MAFGSRIRLLRREKGLTQSRFASCFNLAESTISLYEAEKRSPDYNILKQMAQFFDVSVDYLLGTAEERKSFTIIRESDEPYEPTGIQPNGIQSFHLKLPIVQEIKNGPQGIALTKGPDKWYSTEKTDGASLFWYCMQDQSMSGDGILADDYLLVRQQTEINYGEIGVVIVEDEPAGVYRVFEKENCLVLQPSNPSMAPRIFTGREQSEVRIVGRVVGLHREYK